MAPRRGERVPTANTKKGHKVRSTDISKQGTDKLSKIDVAQNIRKVIAVQKTLQRPSKTSSTQNRSQRLYMRLVGNRKAVRPDHDLMANLRQSCVKTKVTQYGKAELDICVQLISKLSKLTEVDLSCGDDMMASKKKKRVSKRFAAVSSRSGVREPMVQTQGCALRIVRAITKRLLPADANLKRLLGASLGGKNRKAQGEVESKASDQSRKKLNASLSLTSSLAEGPLGLGNGSVLTAIALPGVRLTLECCRTLSRGQMENRGLERLVLSGCLLGDEGLRSLAPGLRSCCINDLSLASCRLTDAGGALLCSIIKAQSARRNDERWAASLRQAAVPDPATRRANEIMSTEVQLGGLVALNASMNHLTDVSAKQFGAALAHDTWMVALNLRGNLITRVGAEEVKKRLETNDALAAVDLQRRAVGTELSEAQGGMLSSPVPLGALKGAPKNHGKGLKGARKARASKKKRSGKPQKAKDRAGHHESQQQRGGSETDGWSVARHAAHLASSATKEEPMSAGHDASKRCYRPYFAFSKPGSVGMCHPVVAAAVVRWGWPDPNDEYVEWRVAHVPSPASAAAANSRMSASAHDDARAPLDERKEKEGGGGVNAVGGGGVLERRRRNKREEREDEGVSGGSGSAGEGGGAKERRVSGGGRNKSRAQQRVGRHHQAEDTSPRRERASGKERGRGRIPLLSSTAPARITPSTSSDTSNPTGSADVYTKYGYLAPSSSSALASDRRSASHEKRGAQGRAEAEMRRLRRENDALKRRLADFEGKSPDIPTKKKRGGTKRDERGGERTLSKLEGWVSNLNDMVDRIEGERNESPPSTSSGKKKGGKRRVGGSGKGKSKTLHREKSQPSSSASILATSSSLSASVSPSTNSLDAETRAKLNARLRNMFGIDGIDDENDQ